MSTLKQQIVQYHQQAEKARTEATQQHLKLVANAFDKAQGVRIENHVGFTQVPLGLAGPLLINGEHQKGEVIGPLATVEPTLVASCSRGAKAFTLCGGINVATIGSGMARAPSFQFETIAAALVFFRAVPTLFTFFAKQAETASRFAKLKSLQPHIIGTTVHIRFDYNCGDASGQNMVTIATHKACLEFLKHESSFPFNIVDFTIDSGLSCDKKAGAPNTYQARGVSVLAWGNLTGEVCTSVLGLTATRLAEMFRWGEATAIRSGQYGACVNVANVICAMSIATGQDAASTLEGGWAQLTCEHDLKTDTLTISLFMPSVLVGSVGGGTMYPTQAEALSLIGCSGNGRKLKLAETMVAFALCLDISTAAALGNDTFTKSHLKLARAKL